MNAIPNRIVILLLVSCRRSMWRYYIKPGLMPLWLTLDMQCIKVLSRAMFCNERNSSQISLIPQKHNAKVSHTGYEIYLSACSASNRAEDLASWNKSCTEFTSPVVIPFLPEVLAKTCAGVNNCVACRNEAVSPIKPRCAKLSSSISMSSTCRGRMNPIKRCLSYLDLLDETEPV